jgi:L-aspartate oxidase
VLVEEGVTRVKELVEMGIDFETKNGKLVFAQEGAHGHRRILHAGDMTGAAIERGLGPRVAALKNVAIHEHQMLLNLLVENGKCYGALVWDKSHQEMIVYLAQITILSTGGYGQLYQFSSNPETTTGDGIVAAYQAGTVLKDLEFIQFHPTTLYLGDRKPVSIFLVSEAVRGEGALLKNIHGERFMKKYDSRLELASRDVVSRAIWNEMIETKSDHVLLDLSEMKIDLEKRFPQIFERCLQSGIDIRKQMIPVVPAAHYCMGGIETDLWGRTNIRNLYAAGECADVGVHGANRLASNSLLDGLVFGHRAAEDGLKVIAEGKGHEKSSKTASEWIPDQFKSAVFLIEPTQASLKLREKLRNLMWKKVGIIRNAHDLKETLIEIEKMKLEPQIDFETSNLLTLAHLVTTAALQRTESRGAHYRSDFKESASQWKHSISFTLKP